MESTLVEAMLRLLEIYARRNDLQRAFPEVLSQNYRELLRWALAVIQKPPKDSDSDKLKTFQDAFETLLLFAEIHDPAIDEWRSRYEMRRIIGASRRWLSLPVIRHFRCLQFRRLRPLRNGKIYGTPVVRYYWARFLGKHQRDIHGNGLEIGTAATIRQYGGRALTKADAIDLTAHSPEVTVIADLSRADNVPSDTFDCFVNQFTMTVIYDVEAALYHSIRILKPGGVLLINFACVDYYLHRGLDMGTGAPLYMHWWFTPIQVVNMLRRCGLAEGDYQLEVYGNLFTRLAFLMNLPAEELTRSELESVDPGHPLLICARAVKPKDWQAKKPEYRNPLWAPQLSPARLSPVTGHYGDDYG